MNTKKWNYSGTTNPEMSAREMEHSLLARKLAEEGIVVLKNESILPLEKNSAIALFGAGAKQTVKGGIGSGDVNNRKNVSIYQGLKDAGVSITSEAWIEDFCQCYDSARELWKNNILEDTKRYENPFDAYAANPFVMPVGRPIHSDDLKNASAAIYVISRISGEGKDRRKSEGDYYLNTAEKNDLRKLDQEKIPTILIINAGGAVELTDILAQTSCIKAILNICQLGQEGGHAVADVLLGKVTPSGRLTSTWAKRYDDYPQAESFGYLNNDLETEEYKEDIFVGYRYFNTFQIPVLFPFGYGLSYTTFRTDFEGIKVHTDGIEILVTVENVGEQYAGKEVVQIYLEFPNITYTTELHRLIGFAKTKCLKPKEKQTLSIRIDAKNLACFSEKDHAWIISEGRYGVCLGKHAVTMEKMLYLNVSRQLVLEKTKKLIHPCASFSADSFKEIRFQSKCKEYEHAENVDSTIPEYMLFIEELPKVSKNGAYFADQQSIDELIPLFYGNITEGASTLGSAGIRVPGSAGETTEKLEEKYNQRSLIMADGPAGLRLRQSYEVDCRTGNIYGTGVLGSLENGYLDPYVSHENADTYYQYCTAFPVGTVIAQTWNQDLVEEFGYAISKEMKEFHVDLWLAPGINIHRNPLCGRNFEYYSEDPILSGMIAAKVVAGVQKSGKCGVTVKHYACNNQEDHRMGVNVCVSERALREIYLRAFELVVKKSAPIAMMTSYNRVNGVYAANNYDLCTTIAREEWGFDGIFMSDWNTTVPEDGSIPWKCVMAGNDIIMPGNMNDDQNIRTAIENGKLTEAKLRESAGRVLETIRRLTD